MRNPDPVTLIFTLGSSPAIVTETLYALYEKQQIVPDELIFVTTGHGRKQLLAMRDDCKVIWDALCTMLGVPPDDLPIQPKYNIRVARNDSGTELEDLQTYEDNRCFADLIRYEVRDACSRENRRVFASLSGGRKTMSAHLLSAMQLFGRPGDKVYHVLVNEPFETIPGFYFPGQPEVPDIELKTRNGQFVSSTEAMINLIEIPFIKLGFLIREPQLNEKSYTELMEIVEQRIMAGQNMPVSNLYFNLDSRVITIAEKKSTILVKLEPKHVQYLLYLALSNYQAGRTAPVYLKDFEETHEPDVLPRLKYALCGYLLTNGYEGFFAEWSINRARSAAKKKIMEELSAHGSDVLFEHLVAYNVGTGREHAKWTFPNLLNIPPELISFEISEKRYDVIMHNMGGFVEDVYKQKTTDDRCKEKYPDFKPSRFNSLTEELIRFIVPLQPY